MSEDQQIAKYFLPSGCLSQSGLTSQLHEEVQGELQARIEKHLAGCELCSLAIKGLADEQTFETLDSANLKLQKQIDEMLASKGAVKLNEPENVVTKSNRSMLRSIFRLRNIAALFPAMFLLGSVLWLTAALQMVDQRLSGLHEFILPKADLPELPSEIMEMVNHVPPAPPVPKFEIVEQIPEVPSGDLDALLAADLESEASVNQNMKMMYDNLTEIFVVVEEPPVYPGGHEAMLEFLSENIRYPSAARHDGIQGAVYLTFVINPDGTVSNVTVLRGVHYLLDEEALRVIRSMPAWTPGRQSGSAVKVQFTMPVRFTLN